MSVSQSISKSRRHRKRVHRQKPASRLRTQVPEELVAQLIGRLVTLVACGLELLLTQPSEVARQWQKRHPEAWFEAEQVPYILLWVAMQVWGTNLERLPEHLDDDLRAPLGSDFVWDPARIAQEFARIHPRLVELAIHDALKEGTRRTLVRQRSALLPRRSTPRPLGSPSSSSCSSAACVTF